MRHLQTRPTHLLAAFTINLALTAAFWSGCVLAAPSSSAIIIVTNTNDSGTGSLRAALAAAGTGNVVQFSLPANSTIVLTSGELVVHVALTIDGSTAPNLTVSGNHASRVLLTIAPLTIRELTIADGSSSAAGGGISATDAHTLTGAHVVNNRSDGAGGGCGFPGSSVSAPALPGRPAGAAAFDLNLFYQVRDEVLAATPDGQRYTDLYDTYSPHIAYHLLAEPGLADDALDLLDLWQPALQTILDGGAMSQTIGAELTRLGPLDDYAGMSVETAHSAVVGNVVYLPAVLGADK
jgi:hypothetical protein